MNKGRLSVLNIIKETFIECKSNLEYMKQLFIWIKVMFHFMLQRNKIIHVNVVIIDFTILYYLDQLLYY